MSVACGASRGLRVRVARDADAVGGLQQVERRRHDQRAGNRADGEHHLLAPGRGAHEVAGLEVLQVVAGDAGGAAHHRADHDGGHRADGGVLAQHQQQHGGREQDGRDGDARNRVVGRAHEAGHVGRHRAEQEAGNHHDHRHRQAHAHVVDDAVVEKRQRQREQHDADQHPLHRQVALGVRHDGHRRRHASRRDHSSRPRRSTCAGSPAPRGHPPAWPRRRDSESACSRACPAVASAHSCGARPWQAAAMAAARSGCASSCVRLEDRDRDVPGDDAAGQHHDADVEPDDVAHAQQRGRQVGAEIGQELAEESRGRGTVGNEPQSTRGRQLEHAAGKRRDAQHLHALRRDFHRP